MPHRRRRAVRSATLAGHRPSWPRLRAVGLALAAFALLGATSRAGAEALRPAILYNLVKFDASFNEGAYRGVERFKSETGTAYREFEVKSDVEREEVLRRFAGRGGEGEGEADKGGDCARAFSRSREKVSPRSGDG